jgi:hypothetical protein
MKNKKINKKEKKKKTKLHFQKELTKPKLE